MAELKTKTDLLNKLRDYAYTPDDDNNKYKEIIKKALLKCPELLYAIHENDLEKELFDDNENLNIDENGEPLGEWDRYFGDNSNIRPFLFIPQTQDVTHNYLCYQVGFETIPIHNQIYKYTTITFTAIVNGQDVMDKQTGIPRHDLIASIIREKFNWSSIFGMQCKLVSNKEQITDNNFLVRTLIFNIEDLNGVSYTPFRENTTIRNTEYWK